MQGLSPECTRPLKTRQRESQQCNLKGGDCSGQTPPQTRRIANKKILEVIGTFRMETEAPARARQSDQGPEAEDAAPGTTGRSQRGARRPRLPSPDAPPPADLRTAHAKLLRGVRTHTCPEREEAECPSAGDGYTRRGPSRRRHVTRRQGDVGHRATGGPGGPAVHAAEWRKSGRTRPAWFRLCRLRQGQNHGAVAGPAGAMGLGEGRRRGGEGMLIWGSRASRICPKPSIPYHADWP